MALATVNPDLVEVALEKVDGFVFERFAQDYLSALEGRNFIPLGGVGDGGADGIYDSGDARTYYQFTKQENHRSKIRNTVTRLRSFGRDVKTLYYLSSRLIPHIDKEEDLLTQELNVIIRIRDRKYIIGHINDSVGTIAAFDNHLHSCTQFLARLTRNDLSFASSNVTNPAAYVFLQHEVTNRLGNRKLIHSITDTMVLWSLSETDPDKAIFMTEDEISARIFNSFPWTKQLLKGHISARLITLRNKDVNKRQVRWYKKENKYCLPYETRLTIAKENASDESLQIQILEELKQLASELVDADDGVYQSLAEIALRVLHTVFERQGLLFAHFISATDQAQHPPIVADCLDEALVGMCIPTNQQETYRDYVDSMIRSVFYHGSPRQREYLANLSRTYVLLFTLQTEPRVIEYFANMSAEFRLYVGSDIIVKALSERYLAKEDQVARNLLRMASDAGVAMFLSQCVLEEVYTHIRATYFEFRNYFAEVEPYITSEVARNSDKILIRAYFYAKEEHHVGGWKSYLGQFMSYENIDKPEGREELRKYLVAQYGLKFTENSELEAVSDAKKVQELADAMLSADDKENEALAYNAALLVHGIYGLRKKLNESSGASEFGLRTWWMTNQTRVLRHTAAIVRENTGQYVMRPEFLLNFIALSPSCEQVRNKFQNLFPSIFGIQLGHRLSEEVFHSIMLQVKEWKNLEPGRITALMSNLSDKLKSDRLKRYQRTLTDDILAS